MMKERHDGNVIALYNSLDKRLKPFGLCIKSWGPLAVAEIESPHSGYIINNVTDVRVIEGFVNGLEYLKNKE